MLRILPPLLLLSLLPPAIAARDTVVNVAQFGATGDGLVLNTAAIQKAIDTCHAEGGGFVAFPAGRFLIGTIELKDNVTLRLDAQTVILGSSHASDYRNVDPFIDGVNVRRGEALIVANQAHHVGIEGAGTVDGQGPALKAGQKPYTIRPFLMRWLHCTDVTIRDVHLTNPGAWTLNFFQSRNLIVERVTIRTRTTGLANNDGIDLDSCENVSVRDCDIDSGDDALCLKATSILPCRNIVASGCRLSTKCNAIKLGTESLGDFEHIAISRCQIVDTRMSGIALYSVDGSHLQDVKISDVTMDGVTVPISIRLGARLRTFRTGDRARPPGILRDITIQNLRVTGARQIGMLINGIPGHPVESVTLENIRIELAGGGTAEEAKVQLAENEATYPEYNMFGKVMPAYGIYARHVRGLTLADVQTTVVKPDARPATVLIDTEP